VWTSFNLPPEPKVHAGGQVHRTGANASIGASGARRPVPTLREIAQLRRKLSKAAQFLEIGVGVSAHSVSPDFCRFDKKMASRLPESVFGRRPGLTVSRIIG
jgi:hypothetical protein